MHRLLLDVLESHARYRKIEPVIRAAFSEKKSWKKMYFNDVLEKLREIQVKGGANSTKDALLHHFVGAARFQAYSKQVEDAPEHLREHMPTYKKPLKTQTINEWDRFEQTIRDKAKKGNAGVLLNRILNDVVGALIPGVPK